MIAAGMGSGPWPVEHHRGAAADFHARSLPEPVTPAIWWFEVERRAIVLGSTQPDDVVDRRAAHAAGVEVARRRSGGGAVLLDPEGVIWLDVVLPVGDPRWEPDVGRSFDFLGRAWVDVLAALGHGGAEVHEGALRSGPWSSLVCFGGLGPGEVTLGGRKVVGISQRRTRHGARFQCALLRTWDPVPLLEVLALGAAERAEAAADLGGRAAGVGPVAAEAVVGELRRALAGTSR